MGQIYLLCHRQYRSESCLTFHEETLLQVERNLDQLKHLPLLLLWGEKDPVFNTDFRDHWLKLWPTAQVHSWPEAGHLLLDEFPNTILPIVRKFRTEHRVRGGLV